MNTTETDEMTFFERNGIRYEQRGDFLHPVTNESCHFIAPLPEDMRRLFPSVEVS